MGIPMLLTCTFSSFSNSLVNTKVVTILHENRSGRDSMSYLIDVERKSPVEMCESSVSSSILGRYGARGPHLKMPLLVGGFVGAKSQSSRDSTYLCDISLSALSSNSSGISENFLRNEFLVSKEVTKNQDCNCLEETETDISISHEINFENYDLKSVGLARDTDKTALHSSTKANHVLSRINDLTPLREKTPNQKKNSIFSPSEDKEKPPIKKPKLNIQHSHSPAMRRRRRKWRKHERNVASDNAQMTTARCDLKNSCFESTLNLDCSIELSNRFSPLQNISCFLMWSGSPNDVESTESPLLSLLNKMHLNEVEFEETLPKSTECHSDHCGNTVDSPLPCESSVALADSVKEDVFENNSENCRLNNSRDMQWQPLKQDNFIQDQLPLLKAKDGSCNLVKSQVETDMKVLKNNISLEEPEYLCMNDAKHILQERIFSLTRTMRNQKKRSKPSKVCFAPESCLTAVHYIPSGPEECQARKGPWIQYYIDRCRFEKRIQELDPIISVCLTPKHRKIVFQRLYGASDFKQ